MRLTSIGKSNYTISVLLIYTRVVVDERVGQVRAWHVVKCHVLKVKPVSNYFFAYIQETSNKSGCRLLRRP